MACNYSFFRVLSTCSRRRWMIRFMINRAVFSTFGFKLGDVLISFTKQ